MLHGINQQNYLFIWFIFHFKFGFFREVDVEFFFLFRFVCHEIFNEYLISCNYSGKKFLSDIFIVYDINLCMSVRFFPFSKQRLSMASIKINGIIEYIDSIGHFNNSIATIENWKLETVQFFSVVFFFVEKMPIRLNYSLYLNY